MDVDQLIKWLSEWAFADSRVELNPERLRECLIVDLATNGGRSLTCDECQAFICGDDSGAIPAELEAAFPHTHLYLEEEWQ